MVIAAIGGINVIEVFFIRDTLDASATTYGLVGAAWMAGMLPGAGLPPDSPAGSTTTGRWSGVLVTLAACSRCALAATVPAAGRAGAALAGGRRGQRRRERLRERGHRSPGAGGDAGPGVR